MRARPLTALVLLAACGAEPRETAPPRVSAPEPVTFEIPAPPPEPEPEPEPQPTALAPLAPGLGVQQLAPGSGRMATPGDRLRVHYVGRLQGGEVFDSSRERGAPFTFELGKKHVIEGFERGLTGLRVGGKRRLIIPPALGYGERGAPPKIPPNATLVFEVELLAIE